MAKKPVKKSTARIPPDDLIDIPGGAKMIYLSRKTLENWLSAGRLTRYKAGRRTLVRKSEILALVREA